jgi:hypothetical protein
MDNLLEAKAFAGQTVLIEFNDKQHTWSICSGEFVPELQK